MRRALSPANAVKASGLRERSTYTQPGAPRPPRGGGGDRFLSAAPRAPRCARARAHGRRRTGVAVAVDNAKVLARFLTARLWACLSRQRVVDVARGLGGAPRCWKLLLPAGPRCANRGASSRAIAREHRPTDGAACVGAWHGRHTSSAAWTSQSRPMHCSFRGQNGQPLWRLTCANERAIAVGTEEAHG